MTSVPRKYRDRIYAEDAKPVVAEPPPSAAETKPETKPAEKPVEKNPVEEAALLKRLQEMKRASEAAAQAQPQPQPRVEPIAIEDEPKQPQQQSVEQIIQSSGLPPVVQNWLRQHPDLITDPAKNAQLQKAHHIAEHLTE